ncbi:phage tail protein, partial [Streptococcus danieliae]|nr:phage tail protein [Streptococcus danieliae]
QSFGGIDTLYSGAEAAAKSYAATAYKAGISANTYAEQAVSFGASLKQALGGDAVAAAKAADMAITDMADNAAKMGTDIGMVQQTYQSLARGNYAMLDNLKLGFGGTKSEMERLLKTAEELTGKKYDISNFADITEAIHAVQESLGIAGVAAEEARTTLSGSFGAMKAAWENTMGAITGKELDITPALEGLAQTASTFLFRNFIPMVGRVMQNLPKAIGTFIEKGRPALEEGLRKTFSEGTVKKIMGVFDGIVDFGSKIKAFFDNFKDTG